MLISWSPNSKEDYRNICSYLISHNILAALDIINRIDGSIGLLSENPYIGRKSEFTEARELVVPQTNYIVIYRIKTDVVELMQIYHAKQNWKR